MVNACIKHNIDRLVVTSSLSAVLGPEPIIDGDETLSVPENFLFEAYANTKLKAEEVVLSKNGFKLGMTSLASALSCIRILPLNFCYREWRHVANNRSQISCHLRRG